MQLDRLNLALRPRIHWEAIDLGFALVLRQWWRLYSMWLLFMLPLGGLIYLLLWDTPWYAGLLVWWLKPLYDRIILYFLSHAIFDEYPTAKQVFNALPQLLFKTRLLASLSWARIDFARSFLLPIWQLEGLSGALGRKRANTLSRSVHGAGWLTLICLNLEWVLYLSFIGIMFLLVPSYYDFDWENFLFYATYDDVPNWITTLQMLLNLTAIGIIEPLYVAGGFTLYLNRRTHLEGWDIELAFRRIAQRLQKEGLVLFLLSVLTLPLLLALPSGADAQPLSAATQPKALIEEILRSDEFRTSEERTHWRYIGENGDWEVDGGDIHWLNNISPFLQLIAEVMELLLWAAAALLLFMGIRYALRHFNWLPAPPPVAKVQFNPLFGEEINHLILRGDVAAQAWQRWQQGEPILALSLLYRGALQVLHERDGLILEEGATEGECLRLVRRTYAADLSGYFADLTRIWQYAAYAHDLPDTPAVEALCNAWPRHFGVAL